MWTPAPPTWHCPACAVEWKSFGPAPCWACGLDGDLGCYRAGDPTYRWTSGEVCSVAPLPELAATR